MKDSILWRSATTVHDWNDGKFVQTLLDRASALQLLGPVTWCQNGIRSKPRKMQLASASELVDKLTSPLPGEPAQRYLEAGGEQPTPWSLKLSIAPFNEATGRSTGPSYLWLFFAKSAVAAVGADALAQACQEVNTQENTEYAFVHDYDHWLVFSDEYYEIPLTIDPMFKGVFWWNAIGPGHLQEFDLQKLPVESANGDILYLRAFDDVLNAGDSESELAARRLTEVFRAAMKPTSKWYKVLYAS